MRTNELPRTAGTTAVITRHFIPNYGSALQAYATQALLRGPGQNCLFIDYRERIDAPRAKSFAGRTRSALYSAYRGSDFRRRNEVFDQFVCNELSLTPQVFHSYEELKAEADHWSDLIYCVGSDQVWNSDYNIDSRPYHLSFASAGSRRFSLSSSIGMRSLPADDERALVDSLRTFAGVSVREADAADYLSRLGVDAKLHVDPTLALSASDWSDFAGQYSTDSPYVLVYQLNSNKELASASRSVGRALGLPVRRIEYWKNLRGRGATRVLRPSVREFVRLFRDAEFVLTDSFHGTAFALNFAKPFVAFRPPRYASRIESVVALTRSEDHLVATAAEAIEIAASRVEPRHATATLAAERDKLRRYVADMST